MPAPRPRTAAGLLVAAVPLPGDAADDVAGRDLASRLRILEKAARAVRRGTDERAVHDLRVALRRLDTALQIWSPMLAPGAARDARRRARRMRRAFTRLRDLEMLRAEWRSRARAASHDLRVALESLIARAERRIATERPACTRRVSRRRIARLARDVMRTRPGPPDGAPRLSAATLADRHVRRMRERALRALDQGFAAGADAALHAARVQVKKWRYAEECELALHKERASSKVVAQLRELQDQLGHAHDWWVAAAACDRRVRKAEGGARVATAQALRRLGTRLARDRQAAIAEAQRLATTLSRPDPLAARVSEV